MRLAGGSATRRDQNAREGDSMRTASPAARAGAALVAVSLIATGCSSKSKSAATPPAAATTGTGAAAATSAPAAAATTAAAAGNTGKVIVWGSTDTPVSYDPAGSYDLPSW